MFCPVCTFREQTEPCVMLENVYYDFLCLIVLEYVAQSIPLSYHWEDFYEGHQPGNERSPEKVGSCSKDHFVSVRAKNDQCIHQCVAMVGT